jgi:hydroxylamine oxidation protein HaoB
MWVKRLPLIGLALIAAGLFLLGWLARLIVDPDPAPYAYRLVRSGETESFPELGLADRKLPVRQYEIHAHGIELPIGTLHVSDAADAGPVVLAWRPGTPEPVLQLGTDPGELKTLAAAVAKHLPEGALLLGWWDISRQLQLLAHTKVLFDRNLSEPLLIPAPWRGSEDAIERLEREFWQVPDEARLQRTFGEFVQALLDKPEAALPRLRSLAGPGEVYVVLQMADAYRAGVMAPERFAIGFRDFPRTGQMHGVIQGVKAWLKEHGYEAYAVEWKDDTAVRVYFLTNAASRDALIARMLPFSDANPLALEAPQVVYQHGRYWVYKLPPA